MSRSQRQHIIMTEGFGAFMGGLAKGAALAPFKAAKAIAKPAAKIAGAFVPNNVKRDLQAISSGLGYKSRKERDFDKRNDRSFDISTTSQKKGKPQSPEVPPKEQTQKTENEHRYINSYLVSHGLKSTKLSGLGHSRPGKGSSRFATVNTQGKPLLKFYPFAPISSTGGIDDDTGYVVYDATSRKMSVVQERLADSQYPTLPNFVTLENSISNVGTR